MGLNVRKCKNIIEETKHIISKWMYYAEKSHITEKRAEEIDKIIKY